MINISFSSACLSYLFVTLGTLFVVGFYFHLKKKDRQNIESSKLHICEYCQHVYLDDIDLQVTSCPQCQLLNQMNQVNHCNKVE